MSADSSQQLARLLQAILFVASEPVSLSNLSQALQVPAPEITAALDELDNQLRTSGLMLLRTGRKYGLATRPEAGAAIERFLGSQSRSELTKPALETLAIIAYRQPVTRSQVDGIRGVSSDQTIRSLLQRGLIVEAGQAETPGRPVLYATSSQFLLHFGLSSHEELPPVDDHDED